MKLSKSNEDTLKVLAALLKLLKSDDIVILTSSTSHPNEAANKMVVAMEKDLRQLRKNLKEMPEPVSKTAEFAADNVHTMYASLTNQAKDAWRQAVIAEMKERLALPDGDEDRIGPNEVLRELNLIDCQAVNQCSKIDLDWKGAQVEGLVLTPGGGTITGAAINLPDSEFEDTPACYANKMQILKQQNLIGVTYAEPDENRNLPLYRKKTN